MTLEHTLSAPAPGLCVAQPRRAFRYGSESFWLAGFALEPSLPRRAADLGTGSGIVPLLLASLGVDAAGFELRPEWEDLWAISLDRSRVSGRVALSRADVAERLPGRYDVVTANPPFFAADRGSSSPDLFRRSARTETTATLARFVEAGLEILEKDGRLCVVLPREREAEIRGPVARVVRVGDVRSLVELRPGFSGAPTLDALPESAPRVLGWFERFGAGLPPGHSA
jgi:tRNA1(Val) A37 N6-methylase TrmN6